MNYWWVNQKQTYRYEVPGGYLWSPKRNTNGATNRSYDAMRTIQPGDMVFSFANAQIRAIGFAKSYYYEFPKPTEFNNKGNNWDNVGWRVDVEFKELSSPLRIKEHISALRPVLPSKYSPIQPDNGSGNQAYLFDISKDFALALGHLIDVWVVDCINGNVVMDISLVDSAYEKISEWEDKIEVAISEVINIPETEKTALIKARVGQGKFRENVAAIERRCRITKVDRIEHLIASHIKPWRDSSNEERLRAENGLMLTPTIDHLFDRGFIGFENSGKLIISPIAHHDSLIKMGVPLDSGFNAGSFTEGQKVFLEWHRESYF